MSSTNDVGKTGYQHVKELKGTLILNHTHTHKINSNSMKGLNTRPKL